MTYEEALKAVRSNKPKENLMTIEIEYNKQLILPYKDGLALLATLERAEVLHAPYNKPPSIVGLDDTDRFKSAVMPYQSYEDIKVANLLGITVDEVKEARKPKQPEPETT